LLLKLFLFFYSFIILVILLLKIRNYKSQGFEIKRIFVIKRLLKKLLEY